MHTLHGTPSSPTHLRFAGEKFQSRDLPNQPFDTVVDFDRFFAVGAPPRPANRSCGTSFASRFRCPRVARRQRALPARVQYPSPIAAFPAAVIFAQLKAIVLYVKPHASITARASKSIGDDTHRKSAAL